MWCKQCCPQRRLLGQLGCCWTMLLSPGQHQTSSILTGLHARLGLWLPVSSFTYRFCHFPIAIGSGNGECKRILQVCALEFLGEVHFALMWTHPLHPGFDLSWSSKLGRWQLSPWVVSFTECLSFRQWLKKVAARGNCARRPLNKNIPLPF